MAEKRIKVSDLSGKEIEDPKLEASLTVEFADKRRGKYHLDLTQDEALELSSKGSKIVEAA